MICWDYRCVCCNHDIVTDEQASMPVQNGVGANVHIPSYGNASPIRSKNNAVRYSRSR
jgi:hypothetical protein